VRLGALSKNRFERLSDVFDRGAALWNAPAAWWWSAYALSAAAAIFGAALTCFTWYEAFQYENGLAERELSARAGDHLMALQNGIDQYINDVSALRVAFQASEHGISRREFQSLSDDLFLDKPAYSAPRGLRASPAAIVRRTSSRVRVRGSETTASKPRPRTEA
jgi:CHASE1-domain containing sensor protein